MNDTIAICVGHSRWKNGRREGGAIAIDGQTSEWDFNDELADLLAEDLHDFDVHVFNSYEGSGYVPAMTWLASKIRKIDAACAIELHFNAATPQARGHEWLHWHSSKRGAELAARMHENYTIGIPSRGLKPIKNGDRGAHFLRLTHCPSIIAEPFFGSNATDWAMVQNKEFVAQHLARGIREWFEDQ